jgi:putative iron-only hydrogenase system regulator
MKRLGFVGIVIESRETTVAKVNEIISEFGESIVARMGVPYQEKACSVITLVVDMDTDTLGRLTGKLGSCPQVSVKSALSKAK